MVKDKCYTMMEGDMMASGNLVKWMVMAFYITTTMK